jgi:23S rRNA pseudouridine2605 synthase
VARGSGLGGPKRSARILADILFHKPRGVVTTRQDPEGRPTIYDVIGPSARGLIAVGRLDLAASGLLLLTIATRLAHRITDPGNAVPRVYLVTVRGRVTDEEAEPLDAASVIVRKISNRETHLTVELQRGRNREVRKLFEAIGHQVTTLKRVRFGASNWAASPPVSGGS